MTAEEEARLRRIEHAARDVDGLWSESRKLIHWQQEAGEALRDLRDALTAYWIGADWGRKTARIEHATVSQLAAVGLQRLDIRDELIDATHETAAFLHSFLWPGAGHDTEPDDGSDCHECYHQAERLLSVIADAIGTAP